jgi:hypothetical protein
VRCSARPVPGFVHKTGRTDIHHSIEASVIMNLTIEGEKLADAIDFDNASQLARIQGGLIEGETLFAVYDMKGGGTGFVGLTDRRVILQDEGVLRKRKSLVSIPYGHISMIASADEGGMMRKTSHLTIITSSGKEFDMEFLSGDKAERAYRYIIQHVT